ncbi:Hypothetical protein PFR_JS25-2_34 [Propionibacterium freudenreichii]|nr:Hypothetical protein PFR_JS25-2_34 [Propionibacterium freudenreichii]
MLRKACALDLPVHQPIHCCLRQARRPGRSALRFALRQQEQDHFRLPLIHNRDAAPDAPLGPGYFQSCTGAFLV